LPRLILSSLVPEVTRYCRSFTDNWLDEITNYFLDRQTSGLQEGLNNEIKVLKRRCYGITNISHLFQRIWLDLEGFMLFGV
jgi:transposase